MDYKEHYIIHARRYDPVTGLTSPKTFGPFDTEADAMDLMTKIQKRHDFVRYIVQAMMYRVSEVHLAGFSTAAR